MITGYTNTLGTQTLNAGPGTRMTDVNACGGISCTVTVSCNPGDLAVGGEHFIVDTGGVPRQDVPVYQSEAVGLGSWTFNVNNGQTVAMDITLSVRCLDITP